MPQPTQCTAPYLVPVGFMIRWTVVNMIFLRGAPPPFSLNWQYEEAASTKLAAVDQEISGSSANLCQILRVPGLLQYSFSYLEDLLGRNSSQSREFLLQGCRRGAGSCGCDCGGGCGLSFFRVGLLFRVVELFDFWLLLFCTTYVCRFFC